MNHDPRPIGAEGFDSRTLREVFDIREWARVFSAHIWWMATITVAVVVGTALTTLTAPKYFRATQRILIERESDKILDVDKIHNTNSANDDYYLTQYKLLESRSIAAAALEFLPAADRAWFERKGDAVSSFMGLRRIVPIRKSRVVDIHAEHPEPKVAEFMALAILKAFARETEGRHETAATAATQRLRKNARDLKAKMLEARRLSHAYKTEHSIVSIGERQSLAAHHLKSLTNELTAVERELSDSNSRRITAERALKSADLTTNLPEVLQNVTIAQFKIQLMDASASLSRLRSKYLPKHPRLIEQQSKVDTITKQINREVLSVFGAVQVENDRLKRHKADIERRIAKQNTVLQQEDSNRIRYEFLVEEAKTSETLYNEVATRLNEVEVTADHSVATVYPVGAAEISSGPVRPRILAAISIAALVGLMLAFGLAFVLDAINNTIKSRADAERHLEAPVIGMVPRLRGAPSNTSIDRAALQPDSNVSEAFRSIRTGILLSKQHEELQSLVVTSTGANEGKSFVSLNLAASFARAGHRVLLVEAEMRRPRLHDALDIRSVEGFSSVLAGESSVESVSFETGEDNLFFMPCGVLPPNPLELLTIGLTTRVRARLSEYFDLVIFDSPPVGIVSDACVLGAHADGVLFVVRTFSADRVRSQRAIQSLRATDAKIAGLIVNHVDGKSERGRRLDFTYDAAYANLPTPDRGPRADRGRAGPASSHLGETTARSDSLADTMAEVDAIAAIDAEVHALGSELEKALGQLRPDGAEVLADATTHHGGGDSPEAR